MVVLQREVAYAGEGISVRVLESTISMERARQNQNVDAIQHLRARNVELQLALGDEVQKLREITQHLNRERERGAFSSGVHNFLAKMPWFGGQVITRRSIEELLRNQYEISSRRLKEAAEFVDRLQAAKSNLFDEIEHLNQKIVESARNEELARERVSELTGLQDRLEGALLRADSSGVEARETQALLDKTHRELVRHATMLKLYDTAEERLAKLQHNTRQLAETIGHLQTDITVYVTAASEKLDLVAGQIQAIGVAADASVVMLELRNSLQAMTESINHTTRFVSQTQVYFRENIDGMLEDLDLYDSRTEQILAGNLALTQGYDEMTGARALDSALVLEIEAAAEQAQLETDAPAGVKVLKQK